MRSVFIIPILLSAIRPPIPGTWPACITSVARDGEPSGRISFADRNNRTGLQGEAEAYINHSPKYYSYLDLAYAADSLFPRLRVAYTLTHNFTGGWEAALGVRYLKLDSGSATTYLVNTGKYIQDYWLNGQLFLTPQGGHLYTAYRITARYYYGDTRDDHVTAIIGSGTSPDDRSRSFQFDKTLVLSSTNVALGYQKGIRGKNIIGIIASWTNQEIEKGIRQNEYDIYINFIQKF
jgi:YaiO family outer membrane protein